METPVLLTAGNQPPLQAMYVSFSSSVLQQVLNGHADMSLIFSDDEHTGVQINNVRYRAQINEEASHMDLYSRRRGQDSNGGENFKEFGRLSHRIRVQNTASDSSVSNSDRMTVLQILALGPLTVDQIALRTKLSADIVLAVAKELGQQQPSTNDEPGPVKWGLKDMAYACLDTDWKLYTSEEKTVVKAKAKRCLEQLSQGYSCSGDSTKNKPPKPTKVVDRAEKVLANGSNVSSVVSKTSKVSKVSKSSSSSAAATTAKKPSSKPPAELLELARQFKKLYVEYEKLYNLAAENGSSDQVKHLMELHDQLSSWKRKLWAASK